MKSTSLLFLFLFCAVLISFFPGFGSAVVSGDCEDCHSLFPGLLDKTLREKYVSTNTLCVICHSSDSAITVKILGRSRVPVVFNTAEPEQSLAGGNFFYVSQYGGDRKGHNVDGITSLDQKFRGHPPGYDRDIDPSLKGYVDKNTLKCAGSNGCHGNRNIEDPFDSITGSHHAVDKPVDGSTTAKSYRFLKNTEEVKGVTGLEDDEWGRRSSPKKHNEYSISMDMFCASCHAQFHRKEEMEKIGPWFRHPTGIVLPETGEYASYNPDIPSPEDGTEARIFNPEAPLARPKVPQTSSDLVKPGEDYVICLSCHVAHSSPYDSILRWDYDNIYTDEEGMGGCTICHTGK
ncbi:MAG: hypothetical protein AB1390_11790 [Nitrospirota bacterium]